VVLRKVAWRLLPFLFLLYVVNILDRINVGFARLQMLDDPVSTSTARLTAWISWAAASLPTTWF
jgi:hypothetical protein